MTPMQPTESTPVPITIEQVRRVLAAIDAGLTRGLGCPEPGQMCVEATVCYGLGLPHGDDPGCVAESLRSAKIRLNDAFWSSSQARARGLRRLGLAQLGSKGTIDEETFVERLVQLVIGKHLPAALRAVASIHKHPTQQAALNAAASKCESDPTLDACVQAQSSIIDADDETDTGGLHQAILAVYEMALHAATAATAATHIPRERAARNAAAAAESAAFIAHALGGDDARDESLAAFAEDVVRLLIEINAPGCQWLDLTKAA